MEDLIISCENQWQDSLVQDRASERKMLLVN